MGKLEYYGGDGYSNSRDNGLFEVKASKNKLFTSLAAARKYYDGLVEDKALWDVKHLELLEAHVWVENEIFAKNEFELPF